MSRNAERAAYLRFKLEMLDKWIHQLNVERRYTDSEFQKLTLKPRDAAHGEQPKEKT